MQANKISKKVAYRRQLVTSIYICCLTETSEEFFLSFQWPCSDFWQLTQKSLNTLHFECWILNRKFLNNARFDIPEMKDHLISCLIKRICDRYQKNNRKIYEISLSILLSLFIKHLLCIPFSLSVLEFWCYFTVKWEFHNEKSNMKILLIIRTLIFNFIIIW